MKKLILIPILILFALLIPLVDAQTSSLLVKNFDFSDTSTTSTTYVDIGSSIFNINKSTNVNVISTLDGLASGGGVSNVIGSWRITIDGATIAENSRVYDDLGEVGSIYLMGTSNILSAGTHTIALQHKTDVKTINSNQITLIINTNTYTNTTLVNNFGKSFIHASPIFGAFEVTNGTFTVINSGSDIISYLMVNSPISQIRYKYNFDDETTSEKISVTFGRSVPNSLSSNGDTFTFKNRSSGVKNFNVIYEFLAGPNSGNGNIYLFEDINDGVKLNHNETVISNFEVGTTFTKIANLTIDIAEFSDLYAVVNAEVNALNGTTSGQVQIRFQLDDGSISKTRSIDYLSLTSNIDKQIISLADIFNDLPSGKQSVSIFAKIDNEGINFKDLSMSLIEVNDYDTNLILPFDIIPPSIDFFSLNTTSPPLIGDIIQVNVTVSDDQVIDTVTLADNSTGPFMNFTSLFIGGGNTTAQFDILSKQGVIKIIATVSDTFGNSVQLGLDNIENINFTVGVSDQRDTYILEGDAFDDSNFGTSNRVETGEDITTLSKRALVDFNTVLRNLILPQAFDFSFVVKYELTVVGAEGTFPRQINAFPINTSWDESVVTWNNFNDGGENITNFNGSKNIFASVTDQDIAFESSQKHNYTLDNSFMLDLLDNNLAYNEGLLILNLDAESVPGGTNRTNFGSSDSLVSPPELHIQLTKDFKNVYTGPPPVIPANIRPLLIKKLSFPDAVSTSSSFVSIETDTFTINKTTDVNIIIELEAELSGGGVQEDARFEWRILLDGTPIAIRNRNMREEAIPQSISLIGTAKNVGLGSHTIDLQHKTDTGTITSRDIRAIVNMNTLANLNLLHIDNFKFNGSLDGIVTEFTTIGTGTFNTSSVSDIIAFLNLNATQTKTTPGNTVRANFAVLYKLDNEIVGKLRVRGDVLSPVVDSFLIGSSFIFEDVPAGVHDWNVSVAYLDNALAITVSDIDGEITFIESVSNSLRLSTSQVSISDNIAIDTTSKKIGEAFIDVLELADVYAIASGTLGVLLEQSDNVEFRLVLGNGSQVTRTVGTISPSAAQTNAENFFITALFEDIPLSTASVSLFAKTDTNDFLVEIENVSLSLIIVDDYDTNVIVPQAQPVITLIAPANLTITNVFPLPITFNVTTSAPSQFPATCTLTNTTTQFNSVNAALGVATNITLTEGQDINRNFTLDINCADNGILFNVSSSLRINYFIDNILPVIETFTPSNGSRFNKDLALFMNISGTCTDFPVFNYNITVENESDVIFTDSINLAASTNSLTINGEIFLGNLGEDIYTVTHICTDTHTKQKINSYQVEKQINQSKIIWITDKENEFELRPSPNVYTVLDYGSNMADSGDRYIVWYVFDEPEDGTLRTFSFELENRKFPILYLPESTFNAHFIMEDNWFDFEFGDENAIYEITQNDFNNYEIAITTTKTTLNFTSIGDLNIRVFESEFEVFFIEQIVDALQIGDCPDTIAEFLILALMIGFALFFIWLGFNFDLGFIGFFGAIALLFSSLYIAACIAILAFTVASLALVLIIYFVFFGFFPTAFGKAP